MSTGDQWQQYSQTDLSAITNQLKISQSSHIRERHYQIFLQQSAKRAFFSAAKRFVESKPGPCAIVKSIADDTFGRLRGEPLPTRVMLMQGMKRMDDAFIDDIGARWVSALNRLGKVFSEISAHYVDYSLWGQWGVTEVEVDQLVACEILNADWGQPEAIAAMRDKMLAHGERAVSQGYVTGYKVLQSIDEPTVFKSVEYYPTMDALREYMKELDPPFEKDAMSCRAAVNRVRQLYQCTDRCSS